MNNLLFQVTKPSIIARNQRLTNLAKIAIHFFAKLYKVRQDYIQREKELLKAQKVSF